MLDAWDIYGNQTDDWGYTRYSLAVHAPPVLAQEVMAFRAAIGLADLTSEPHVSISASLYQPTDLDDLKTRLARAARTSRPFEVPFADQPPHLGSHSGGLAVAATC